jgi:hypothetical protein
MSPEAVKRFWKNVDFPSEEEACWMWTGHVSARYGSFRVKGKNYRAHRLAFELLVGPIPEGLVIDHLCRTPLCVNPTHMEPVTQAENLRRAPTAVATINASKTHCVNGHELNGRNVFITTRTDGTQRRNCRACKVAAQAAWKERVGYVHP